MPWGSTTPPFIDIALGTRLKRVPLVDNPSGQSSAEFSIQGSARCFVSNEGGRTTYLGGGLSAFDGRPALGLVRFDDGFPAPNSDATVQKPGTVTSFARQADGKPVIGGSFAAVGDKARFCLARLNIDGSLDGAWNPAPNSTITSLAPAGDYLFAAGGFTKIGGVNRNGLARFTVSSGQESPDAEWDAKADKTASFRLGASGDDLIIVGGYGVKFGAVTSLGVVRAPVIGTGAVSPTWIPPLLKGLYAADFFALDRRTLYLGNGKIIRRVSLDGPAEFDPNWSRDEPEETLGHHTAIAAAGGYLYVARSGELKYPLFNPAQGAGEALLRIPLAGSGTPDPMFNPKFSFDAANFTYSEVFEFIVKPKRNPFYPSISVPGSGTSTK